MATENVNFSLPYDAASDLSDDQYKIVTINSSGNAALAGAGDYAVGVLQNDPKSGESAEVAVLGKSKVEAGGSISQGDQIAANSNGKAVTATQSTVDTTTSSSTEDVDGSNVIGIADESASSGELFGVVLLHTGAVPSTES